MAERVVSGVGALYVGSFLGNDVTTGRGPCGWGGWCFVFGGGLFCVGAAPFDGEVSIDGVAFFDSWVLLFGVLFLFVGGGVSAPLPSRETRTWMAARGRMVSRAGRVGTASTVPDGSRDA